MHKWLQDKIRPVRSLKKARAQKQRWIKEQEQKVLAGLALLDSKEADEIIVEPGPGYKEIVQAVKANHELLYAVTRSDVGAPTDNWIFRAYTHSLAAALQLAHYAYALGKQSAQEVGGGEK